MEVFSKFKKITRNRKILVLGIIILVLVLTLYKSDRVMIDKPQQLAKYIRDKTNIDFFPLWTKFTNSLFRMEDEINIFRIKKNLLDGELPIYNLELTSKVLGHLDNTSKISVGIGYLDSEVNRWKSAKLNVDGKEYGVKVKLHGDSFHHWSGNLKSYKIKSDKGKFINNMRHFNLILFEDRLFSGLITRVVAKDLGLMDIRDDIVVLKINGIIQGIYYLQERLDYTFLENNQCSNCEIIRISDNWLEDHPFFKGGGVSSGGDITPFDYELSNVDLVESELNKDKVLYSVYKLYEDINNDNLQNLITNFDIYYLSSFRALRMIVGAPKLIVGNDFKMAYSATNSKFYPIPRNEHIRELRLVKGGFENSLTKTSRFIQLFYLLAQDDQLTYLRNKKIYQYISNANIIDEVDESIDKYLPYALSYKTNTQNSRIMKRELKNTKKVIEHNLNLLKNNFEYSKAYINVIEKNNKIILEIIPDSIPEIKFNNLKINLTKDYFGKLTFVYNNGKNTSSTRSLVIKNKTDLINLMEFVEDLYFFSWT